MTTTAAPAAQDRQVCRRCAGTGLYETFGSCWRCEGSGMVSLARIKANFLVYRETGQTASAEPVEAATPAPQREENLAAIALRKAQATAAKMAAAGYKGKLRWSHDRQRIEYLGSHRKRPGVSFHITWHARGRDAEVLEGRPSDNWPDILA